MWRIRFGEGDFSCGLGSGADVFDIAVPGSWNEQLAEAGFMNYVGTAWLECRFFVPHGACRLLRFGSADYFAKVWVDGREAGVSRAPMLPFELDVTGLTTPGTYATLVVRVTNELPIDGPTQRVTLDDYAAEHRTRDEYVPAVRFDFFPYGGLSRPVHLVTRPAFAITSYRITTRCSGVVGVSVEADGGTAVRLCIGEAVAEAPLVDGKTELRIELDEPRLWSPASPELYDLRLELLEDGRAVDEVGQKVGIREILVEGNKLLLNGEPIVLKGFGKHEDSPIRGRGLDLPLLVKDFGLLKWTGANSVRTSHYPYSEEFYDFADRSGILVIDEVFSVNLDFRKVTDQTLAAHKDWAVELVERDRNRACVIAWSLANEPGYLAEPEYLEKSGPYWEELFGFVRKLDPSRPLTHANVGYVGTSDPAFDHADIVTINRYHGWYSQPAQLDRAIAALRADLDVLAQRGKPIFVAEFGADALSGQHATYDQLFTEEYQSDFIAAYWSAISEHPSCIGGHVWNFADFRTAQHGRRVVLNLKGVFTRGREPKRAAWTLRGLWA